MNWEQFDTDENVKQIKHIRRELVAVLRQYRENTHPLMLILALMPLFRTLLRTFTKSEQKELLPILKDWLSGRTKPSEPLHGIILPPDDLVM